MTYEEARKELIAFKGKSWDGMSEEVIDKAIEGLGILSRVDNQFHRGGYTHSSTYVDTDAVYIPKSKILLHLAKSIKQECLANKTCEKCIFYNKTGEAPVCALMVTPPEYWNLSQLNGKEVKK